MRAITITGYRRPHLFRVLLDSLLVNDLNGWTIHIGLEPGDCTDEFGRIAAELLQDVSYTFHVNSRVLGIRENPYQLLQRTFNEGAELVLYLEEDLLLARDTTMLAKWYANNHRSEWMCLSLLSGGCGSAGFISDPQYADLLFPSKSFNSLGFVCRRQEWSDHLRDAWMNDSIHNLTLAGTPISGWDWAVYFHLIRNDRLYALQTVGARATHTGREGGVYCLPDMHDIAFECLGLAAISSGCPSYRVVTHDALPAHVRRQALLWDQANQALRVMERQSAEIHALKSGRDGVAARLELNEASNPRHTAER
jgi:hypothetical protein